MTIYFTSDLHFNHDRSFIYKPRGFNSIQEHDEEIIARWNSRVTPDDVVYHLGDAMMGPDLEYGLNCLRRLNGEIYMIRGNHDSTSRWEGYDSLWPHVIISGWAHILKAEGYKFYLCHYKTETSCLENTAKLKHHLINLHGHTHSKHKFEDDKPYQYNVALDAHNCYPIALPQVISDIENKVQECLSYL